MAQERIDHTQKNIRLSERSPFDSATEDYNSLDEGQKARQVREKDVEEFKAELNGIKKAEDNTQYEEFCKKLIGKTFQEFDADPERKIREFDYDDGTCGNEYDVYINLRLKTDAERSCNFWEDIMHTPNETKRRGYSSQVLIFECKNNNLRKEETKEGKLEEKGLITEDYIYQLFRYLSPKNKFGILMCRKMKLSRHARKAISRVRAEGYFILIIDDKLLNQKKNSEKDEIDGWFETYIERGNAELFFRNHYDRQEKQFREENAEFITSEAEKQDI
jgi:hypothetical protein